MGEHIRVVLYTPSIEQIISNEALTWQQYSAILKTLHVEHRMTLVGVLDREELRIGVAICNTKTDQFSKKYGVQLATARALVKPIEQHGRLNGEWDKKKVLEKLKDLHMHIGNHISDYKKMIHGVAV